MPRAERDARLKRAAAILGLDALLDRKPSQLSGGQQQRVALGRAIVAETPVCLMDEPLSNLDAQLRVEMRREIRALQRRLGMTMLYVTHDQVEAMTMADQVVLLRNGRIEQDAAPAVLYEKPATHLRGALRRHAADERDPGRARSRRRAMGARGRTGRTCTRHARGRRAARSPRASPPDGIPATVAAVEYLGADTLIETRLADQSFIVRDAGPRACDSRRQRRHPLGAGGRALVRSVITASHRSIRQTPSNGRNIMDRRTISRRHRRARSATVAAPALAQGVDRSVVLLSDRGRRPDHQDHRRLRGGFREGQSRRSR